MCTLLHKASTDHSCVAHPNCPFHVCIGAVVINTNSVNHHSIGNSFYHYVVCQRTEKCDLGLLPCFPTSQFGFHVRVPFSLRALNTVFNCISICTAICLCPPLPPDSKLREGKVCICFFLTNYFPLLAEGLAQGKCSVNVC